MHRLRAVSGLFALAVCVSACTTEAICDCIAPDPLATRVEVTDSLPSLFAGDTLRLYASASTATGVSAHGVAWTSQNTAIATVDGSGIITGVAPGTVTIRATVDTAKVDVPVVVIPPPSHSATQLSYAIRTAPGNFSLRIANVDGSPARTLVGPNGSAGSVYHGWSRDGSLFFSQLQNVTLRTTTITDAAGTVVHDLTGFPEIFPNEPAPDFSPDNGQLIYTEGTTTARQVRFMLLPMKLVTSHAFVGSVYGPSWSPDGRRWAAIQRVSNLFRLVVARADGTGERIIPMNAAELGIPRWSLDGRYIAMTLGDKIAIVTPDARVSTTVGSCATFSSCTASFVTWSPDGKSLAYLRIGQPGAVSQVVVRPIFGLTEVAIPGGGAPSWSPDGQWIAFAPLNSGASPAIQLVHPDGSGLKPLNADTDVGSPIWRP
jgi:Tol biopolymer transport system component